MIQIPYLEHIAHIERGVYNERIEERKEIHKMKINQMKIYYEVKTVVELTEEQNERLKKLIEQMKQKQEDQNWNERKALEFLTMIRSPEFWDIQLNLFEKMIQEL